MKEKSGAKTFLKIINSKPVIGAFIFIMLSLATVFAGNVFVRDGNIDMNNNSIGNLSDPVVDYDVATKKYVDGEIALVSGETTYLSIPHAAFRSYDSPELPSDEYNYGSSSYGYIAPTDTANEINFIAPVYLPNGSVVTGVIGYATDSGANCKLYRASFSDASADEMSYAGEGTMDTSISYSTIDNENYYYYIYLGTIDSSEYLYGAKIRYTLP